MVNSKDKVDFLVLLTFFFNLEKKNISCLRWSAGLAAICGQGFPQFAGNIWGQEAKKFLNVKKNPPAKFQPSNISDHNFTGI